MKIVKIKPNEYKDPVKLLSRVGFIDHKNNQCFPDYVYVNQMTYKHFKQKVKEQFKKECKEYSKKKVEYFIEMHMLNYAPCVLSNENGGKLLPFGYAIIFNKNLHNTHS